MEGGGPGGGGVATLRPKQAKKSSQRGEGGWGGVYCTNRRACVSAWVASTYFVA